jgi:ER-bound oxygenase mpaB/B'/Rubber oxygenase, catalytic domain
VAARAAFDATSRFPRGSENRSPDRGNASQRRDRRDQRQPAARADAHGRTQAERLASRDGYFAPESVIRKVGNSPLTPFLGGGPAVLLQVAHPLVAAFVVQHSDNRRGLWRRRGRTLRALYLITYRTKAEAARAAEAVQTVPRPRPRKTDVQLGRFPAGASIRPPTSS